MSWIYELSLNIPMNITSKGNLSFWMCAHYPKAKFISSSPLIKNSSNWYSREEDKSYSCGKLLDIKTFTKELATKIIFLLLTGYLPFWMRLWANFPLWAIIFFGTFIIAVIILIIIIICICRRRRKRCTKSK